MVFILCDSNGKSVRETAIPWHVSQKAMVQNNSKCLEKSVKQQIKWDQTINHTGTNDLMAMRGHVAHAMQKVAARAAERFPNTKLI